MTSERTLKLQISGFDNCQGSERRVHKALHGRVKSLSMDPNTGDITVVLTDQDPEAIKAALKREFSHRDIILLHDTGVAPNPQRFRRTSSNVINNNMYKTTNIQQVVLPLVSFQDMAQASLIVSRDKGVQRVKFTQKNTILRNAEIIQDNSFEVKYFADSEKRRTTSRLVSERNNVPVPRVAASLQAPPRSTIRSLPPVSTVSRRHKALGY